MEKKSKFWIYFNVLCVALILIGSIGAWLIASSGGDVKIIRITIPTNDGQWLTANLYKPKSATAEHPAPAVITCHGFTDSKEKQDLAAIELSRRGIVVIQMDAYMHGFSSGTVVNSSPGSTFAEGVGMIPMVKFIASSEMNYIDKTNIGVTGHSMGGFATQATLQYFGGLEGEALAVATLAGSPGGTTITSEEKAKAKALNPVSAGFILSALPDTAPESHALYHANIALEYTYFDEGVAQFSANGNGDMSIAPEALAFVNAVLPNGQQLNQLEIGKNYGSVEAGNLRVVYNSTTTHTLAWLSPSVAKNMVSFFTNAFRMNTTLAANNQVFLVRKLFTGMSLVGLLMLIPIILSLLLHYKFFDSIKRVVPAAQPALTKVSDKMIFWGSFLIIILATVSLLVPVIVLTNNLFPDVANHGTASSFPDPNVNPFAIWSLVIGAVTLILFIMNYR